MNYLSTTYGNHTIPYHTIVFLFLLQHISSAPPGISVCIYMVDYTSDTEEGSKYEVGEVVFLFCISSVASQR